MGFPKEFVLNGADTFLMGLDAIYRKKSKQSNCCTLAIELGQALTPQGIIDAIEQCELFRWTNSLRLKGHGPFRRMTWKAVRNAPACTVSVIQIKSVFDLSWHVIPSQLNPARQSPIRITLAERPGGHALLFTWHHGLMDAHGAETFLKTIARPLPSGTLVGVNANGVPDDWKDHLTIRDFLSEVSAMPFSTPADKGSAHGFTQYTVLRLDEEETRASDALAAQVGAGANPSLFYMALCGQFVGHLLTRRNIPQQDMLIPVPLDLRRRGSPYPIMSNQLSFLFYRIKAEHANCLEGAVKDLTQQLMNMLRMQFPKRYAGMMELLRWVPRSIYPAVIASTTKGNIASFLYSDTGTSLDRLDQVLGQDVINAVHYPPNLHPPGITFIISRIRNTLHITIGYREDYYTAEALKNAVVHLRERLMTAATSSPGASA
ncbi:MAG: hypothetical protein O3C57_07385 [Verrucomicrobia bacterium]|nr:hypothetical protein [Verrucomicrobiota bacterium]